MPGLPHPRGSLHGYVDGRLPGWRRALLEHHLLRCTRCSVEVARTRSLSAWLAQGETPSAPEDLLRRLRGIGAEDPHLVDGPTRAADGSSAGPVSDEPAADPGPPPPVGPWGPGVPVDRTAPGVPAARRGTVGVAGVLVAGAVLVGTVGLGAVVTSTTVPWPGAPTARVQLSTVLPALWTRSGEPDGADPTGGADNGRRP